MGRITLWGFNAYDPTLFDDVVVPEAADKQTIIDTIMMECGDCYTYYQHPGYLKKNITMWFKRMLPNFERAFNAITIDYSPIENYDRHEDWTDSESGKNNSSANSSASASGDREDKISAFNSSTYQPDARTDSSNQTSQEQTVIGTDSRESTHSARIHGNIGTLQNTTMVQAELELRRYDIYVDIARQFEHTFITQIY